MSERATAIPSLLAGLLYVTKYLSASTFTLVFLQEPHSDIDTAGSKQVTDQTLRRSFCRLDAKTRV